MSIDTSCPVCGRYVFLNHDGTLWNHFTSWMNQDDSTQPICIGSGIKVVTKKKMDELLSRINKKVSE